MRHARHATRPAPMTVLCTVLVTALLLLASPPIVNADGAGGTPRTSSNPIDPDYTKAVASIKSGEFTTAIPLLEGAVARDDTNADAYNWLAYSVRRGGARALDSHLPEGARYRSQAQGRARVQR